ncbi:hypothetical protein OAK19_03145 [Aureispira]|nr:hypothetical protein [Aureispira sp.]
MNILQKKVQLKNKELEDFEKSEGIEYFLIGGKTDYRNMMRIYRDFFERFEIPYFFAIAKNRFSGPIDLNFVSSTQIGEYFFIFKNGDGYLSINGMGCLNELPWNFYGTKCYMRDVSDRQATLQEINFGDAPLKDSKQNKRFSRSQVQVNLKDNTITQKVSNSYSGLYVRSARGWIVTGHKADTLNKTIQKNYTRNFRAHEQIKATVSNAKVSKFETSPLANFAFKYGYDVSIENLIQQDQDMQAYTINIDEFLNHNIRYVVNPENRILDYHLPYLGIDKEELILVFDKEVALANAVELVRKVENEFASYEFKVTQIKPNMIRIQSFYNTKELFIDKMDAKKLDEINQAFIEVRDSKFYFKLK